MLALFTLNTTLVRVQTDTKKLEEKHLQLYVPARPLCLKFLKDKIRI